MPAVDRRRDGRRIFGDPLPDPAETAQRWKTRQPGQNPFAGRLEVDAVGEEELSGILDERGDRQAAADVGLGVGPDVGRYDLDRGRTRAGSLADAEDQVPPGDARKDPQATQREDLLHLGRLPQGSDHVPGAGAGGPVGAHDVRQPAARFEQFEAAVQEVVPKVHPRRPVAAAQRAGSDGIEHRLGVQLPAIGRIAHDPIEAVGALLPDRVHQHVAALDRRSQTFGHRPRHRVLVTLRVTHALTRSVRSTYDLQPERAPRGQHRLGVQVHAVQPGRQVGRLQL